MSGHAKLQIAFSSQNPKILIGPEDHPKEADLHPEDQSLRERTYHVRTSHFREKEGDKLTNGCGRSKEVDLDVSGLDASIQAF